jgi:hypothetical protein
MAPLKKTSTAEKKAPFTSTTMPPVNDYNARRSARVAAGRYTADDDNWVEALAVCESGSPTNNGGTSGGGGATKKTGGSIFGKFKPSSSNKGVSIDGNDDRSNDGDADVAAASQRLTIRPYFQSQKTGKRVWDEPPSGASNIVYATPEARRMAHAQLEEMRSSFARAALVRRQERAEREAAASSQQSRSGDGRGGGRLSMIPKAFKRASAGNADANQSSSSLLGNDSQTSRRGRMPDDGGIPKSILDESRELAGATDANDYEADLQRAMLMSMGIGGGSVMGVGDNKHRSSSKSIRGSSPTSAPGLTRMEEEQLVMAMALSLSEQEARQSKSTNRSKSSSYTRSDSNDGIVPGVSTKQGGYLSPHGTTTNHAKNNAKSTLAGYDRDFDGGGKMPAVRHAKNEHGHADIKKGHNDFGDWGAGWEMDWKKTAPPNNKDWEA